jgi:oligopeptide transport system permease protein
MRVSLDALLRKGLSAILTLGVLSVSLFFLVRWIPGGPFDSEQKWPPEVQANILRHYGLDQPLFTQLSAWLRQLISLELGESFQFAGVSVGSLIFEGLGVSAFMGGIAFSIALLLGVSLGVLSNQPRVSWIDAWASPLATVFLSTPSYLLGALLVLVFALSLGWLPPALLESPSGFILPIVALTARPWAMIFRMTRSSVASALDSDYVRTALAKGLSAEKVLWTHVLKNALLPVLSLFGPIAAHLLTGSFVVELVFQLPGLGKYFVGAVLNRDYPLVQGLAMTFGTILLLLNLLFETVQSVLDPRLDEGSNS